MFKRPLVWVAASFAVAVVLLTNFSLAEYILPAAAVCMVALALLRPVPPAARSGALVVLAGILLAWGAVTLNHSRLQGLEVLDGRQSRVRMTVLAEEEGVGYSLVTLHGLIEVEGEWKSADLRALSYEVAGWQPGDKVEGILEFELPEQAGDLRLLRSRGRFANAEIVELSLLPKETKLPSGPVVWGAKLNHALSEGLLTALPGDLGDLAQSVLLGRRERLSDGVDEQMRRSGVAHVMVVSGLHLSLICGAVLTLLRRGNANRWIRFGTGAVLCLAVMAAAGFTPSVARGGIMMLLVLLADALGRQSDPYSSLAAAVLVMGIYNPYVFYSWSFLLSVCSLLSILTFAPPMQRRLLRWRKERFPTAGFADRLLSVAAVNLGAAVYTYPVLSVMFGGLAVYGLLGNLLITPLAGVMLVSAALAAVLGAIGLSGLAAAAAVPAGFAAALCRWAAAFVAGLPGSWLPIDRPWQLVWLAGAAVVLTLLLLLPTNSTGRAGLAGLALAVALLAGVVGSMLTQGSLIELHTFENSSALVILYRGQTVVIDADREGIVEADHLSEEHLLYTFGQNKAQQAALILQEKPGVAAALYRDNAREIAPYLLEQTRLLDLSQEVKLDENFSLAAGEGYTLVKIDDLRVLKLLDGYVIINDRPEFPPADLLVTEEGIISPVAEEETKPLRSLRFTID